MELACSIMRFAVSVVGSLLSRQIYDEFKAWTPHLITRVVSYAVSWLPNGQQERFHEEWTSHVNDVPGEIGKFIVAIGFISAALRISADTLALRMRSRAQTFRSNRMEPVGRQVARAVYRCCLFSSVRIVNFTAIHMPRLRHHLVMFLLVNTFTRIALMCESIYRTFGGPGCRVIFDVRNENGSTVIGVGFRNDIDSDQLERRL